MRVAHYFTDRPVFAAVVSITIVVVGTIAAVNLPIQRHPDIAPPTVVVTANYPGASAQTIADTVATPIEQEVNGVDEMLYMTSQSVKDGTMQLTVTFDIGTDLDIAQVLVQNRVALALPHLPEEVRRTGISVRKSSPDLSLVVNLYSTDGRYDQLYLSNYALIQIRDVLARVPGVGDVHIFGARDYSMRVWLDPEELASRNLTAMDVVDAIREQNVEVAAGALGQPPVSKPVDLELSITAAGRLSDADEFGDIVIKTGADGRVTHLHDVARTELGAANYASNVYMGRRTAVAIPIFQEPGSNSLETKAKVVEAMDDLKANFPPGLDYRIVYDTTIFIDDSIHEVVRILVEAVLIVLVVVMIFLQNWRAILIPMLAVPVSIIGTFAVMALLGFSINTLSLAAMVLAVGIVVDDAIVVVENVERNLAAGLDRRAATFQAMEEVSGPIIASALVLSAVFIPTAFMAGISGQFYRQFALTIAASTVISAINSLTLSPALAALLLQSPSDRKDRAQRSIDVLLGWFFRLYNRAFDRVRNGYVALTKRLVRSGAPVLLVYAILIGLTVFGFAQIPTGFIPEEDQGFIFGFIQLPDAASIERTDAVARRARDIVLATPGVKNVMTIAGWSIVSRGNQPNVATLFIPLRDFEERAHEGRHALDIVADLNRRLSIIQDGFIAIVPPPPVRGIGNVGGVKLQIQDRGARGIEALQAAADDLAHAASQLPEFGRAFTTFRANVPQIYVDVDRTQAESLGVPVETIFDTLQVYLGSLYANDFNLFGRTYRVIVQADARYREEPADITRMETRNANGEMVPLGTLVEVQESWGADTNYRFNLFPSAEVNAAAVPGISSSDAIALLSGLAAQVLPLGFSFEWTELAYLQNRVGDSGIIIFALCVLFVFLTLAAFYESWSMPIAVVLIVPLCVLSAIAALWYFDMSISIFAQIVFIVLVGLASKNAILIVEFAKELQDRGNDRFTAAVEAARLRLRPIVMTSFAFIFGVLPLATAVGAGAEGRKALGIPVLSGMLGVTVFGLIFTPVFYVIVRRFSKSKVDRSSGDRNSE
jgi:multidrug efflux pump